MHENISQGLVLKNEHAGKKRFCYNEERSKKRKHAYETVICLCHLHRCDLYKYTVHIIWNPDTSHAYAIRLGSRGTGKKSRSRKNCHSLHVVGVQTGVLYKTCPAFFRVIFIKIRDARKIY